MVSKTNAQNAARKILGYDAQVELGDNGLYSVSRAHPRSGFRSNVAAGLIAGAELIGGYALAQDTTGRANPNTIDDLTEMFGKNVERAAEVAGVEVAPKESTAVALPDSASVSLPESLGVDLSNDPAFVPPTLTMAQLDSASSDTNQVEVVLPESTRVDTGLVTGADASLIAKPRVRNIITSEDLTVAGGGIFAVDYTSRMVLTPKDGLIFGELRARKGDINYRVLGGREGIRNAITSLGPDSTLDAKDIAFKRYLRSLLPHAKEADSASVALLNRAIADRELNPNVDSLYVNGKWRVKNGLYTFIGKSGLIETPDSTFTPQSVPHLMDLETQTEDQPVVTASGLESFFFGQNPRNRRGLTFVGISQKPFYITTRDTVHDTTFVAVGDTVELPSVHEVFGHYGNLPRDGFHVGGIGYANGRFGFTVLAGTQNEISYRVETEIRDGKAVAGGSEKREVRTNRIGATFDCYLGDGAVRPVLSVGAAYVGESGNITTKEYLLDKNGNPYMQNGHARNVSKHDIVPVLRPGVKIGPGTFSAGFVGKEPAIDVGIDVVGLYKRMRGTK